MKSRFVLAATVVVTMALALAGFLNGVGPVKALNPDPIQPFDPVEVGGLSTTQLGAPVTNYAYGQMAMGGRIGLPWIFSPPAFDLQVDKEIDDGTPIGTVTSQLDALCDGNIDSLVQSCANMLPYPWVEATTAVEGTADDFLKAMMPPFSFVVRHKADITNLCISGGTDYGTINVLNTVYTNVPWSPNGAAYVANTKLGGNPTFPTSSSGVCLDSPQNSFSVTSVYKNPPAETDSDRPCLPGPGITQCADAAVVGMWAQNTISVPVGLPGVVIPVTKMKTDNGPVPGLFWELWETEVTAGNITAVWSPENMSAVTLPVLIGPGPMPQGHDLQITCNAPGEGLVVLKNILWPNNNPLAGPITKDIYADDNAFTFVIKVLCGGVEGVPLVDKEVIWIKPTSVGPTMFPSTPKHLQMVPGEMTIITIDELKANHHTAVVPGQEWLVAEVSDVDGVEGPDVMVAWGGPFVETFPPVPVTPPVDCSTSPLNQCMTYIVDEPHGQVDVIANLQVMCPITTRPGLYSIVIKGIDAPLPPFGELKPSDNANRSVIKVWCGMPNPEAGNPDGIDDAAGYFPRWTAFQSQPAAVWPSDSRKGFKSPPAIPSDVGYVERVIDLQCFWMDSDGAPDLDGDTIIQAWESLADAPPGSDSDGDCLADFAFAQPSHPVDLADEPIGPCDYDPADPDLDPLPYSEAPNLIQHDQAADMDCDGIVDGIEKAWGSNPYMADSDNDGASDFVEMFQFTNPLNPDTDGDGIKDKPDDDYIAAAAGGHEGTGAGAEADSYDDNCPGIYNPDQANNDGKRRDNGMGGRASNPTGDKTGDLCDSDDDNDAAVDVAELAREDPVGTPDPTNPMVADTDGDRCLDGIEGYLGKDPTSATSKCPAALSTDQLKFTRACRWNLPPNGYDGGLWDAEYDLVDDQVEWDPDGDGLVCQSGTSVVDTDNDNGTYTGAAASAEIADNVEIKGYGTGPALKDTDGDGCDDWKEIVDVDGNRKAGVSDVMHVAKRGLGITPPGPYDPVLDIDKNGALNASDAMQAALNSELVKPHGPCTSEG